MREQILLCLTSVFVIGLSACGEKDEDSSRVETPTPAAGDFGVWDRLDDGLEIGRFRLPQQSLLPGDSHVTIVRIDPQHFEIQALCAVDEDHGKLRADDWARRYGFAVVVNAGMFDISDHSTHVGYMHTTKGVNQGDLHPDYSSVFAFDPKEDDLPLATIYDTDETNFGSVIKGRFSNVVQNLRLIKRPGENRWTQQEKRWSECALGQDGAGNILLIYCRAPYSMHDLNLQLLKLPIDLRCAQHLEGGPEASIFLDHAGTRFIGIGSYETGFNENDDNNEFWPVPNVIGFRKKVE